MENILSFGGYDAFRAGISTDLIVGNVLRVNFFPIPTMLTAQSSKGIKKIVPVDLELIKMILDLILDEIKISYAKIGAFWKTEIGLFIKKRLAEKNIPYLIDPIIKASKGGYLVENPDFILEIVPGCEVITPNVEEALQLSKKANIEDAGKFFLQKGAKNVVITGGTLESKRDTLITSDGRTIAFDGPTTYETHGSGCIFSAALAAYLSKDYDITLAVKSAKEFTHNALKNSLKIATGFNIYTGYSFAENGLFKWDALNNLKKAITLLESVDGLGTLVPEVQSNLVELPKDAMSVDEAIGIPGRIVALKGKMHAVAPPEVGGSKHVAKAVFSMYKKNPRFRSCINIRYSPEIKKYIENNFKLVKFDRRLEPPEIKKLEGKSMEFAVNLVKDKDTDVIFDMGDFGKEPMFLIFGEDSIDVAKKVIRIFRHIQ